jgi:photosystem II stability/assembly factor-like uncharacterized protein
VTTISGTVAGPAGKPVQRAIVIAAPVGAGSLLQAAARTGRDGKFRLALPDAGVYDLFAVDPGAGGVAAATVGTLTEAHARIDFHLPSWRGRRFVVVLQQGLAYSRKRVWVWGDLPGAAPVLSIQELPGVMTVRTVHLAAQGGPFAWSGPLGTQPLDLSASYTVTQGNVRSAGVTFPGVGALIGASTPQPQNLAPYHLAWGSVQSSGARVRLNVGDTVPRSAWGSPLQPDGRVAIPAGIGVPWADTVVDMLMPAPPEPLLSMYEVQGGPLAPPPDSFLRGFRLSSGTNFALPLAGAQMWRIDMLSSTDGWAMTRDNQVLYTRNGGTTWRDVTPNGMTNVGPAGVSFASTDPQDAWLAVTPIDAKPTIVYRTANGGQSWQSVGIAGQTVWPKIRFLNGNTGILLLAGPPAAGSAGLVLYRSADGGATWSVAANETWSPTHTPTVFGGDKNGFGFNGTGSIWLTGSDMVDTVLLYVSRDGGHSWQSQQIPLPHGVSVVGGDATTEPPLFFGPVQGILPVQFGSTMVFYGSRDGGLTWSPTSPVRGDVYSVVNASDIFVSDGTMIYRTSDGGANWAAVQPNRSFEGVSALDFINALDGWAILNGEILRTTDGGASWTDLSAAGS